MSTPNRPKMFGRAPAVVTGRGGSGLADSIPRQPLICGAHKIDHHISELHEYFAAVQRDRFDVTSCAELVNTIERFARLANESEQTGLSTTLNNASDRVRALLDSPLDLDQQSLGIERNRLLSVLTSFQRRFAQANAGLPVADIPLDGNSVSKASSSTDETPRTETIPDSRIDELHTHVSRLYVTCESYRDLHDRTSRSGIEPSLIETWGQMNRALAEQTQKLEQGLAALRPPSTRGKSDEMTPPHRQTTAVVDGLLLLVGDQDFLIPLAHVVEVVELDANAVHTVLGTSVVTVRNTTFAAVSLADVLGVDPRRNDDDPKRPAVLVRWKHETLCLLADAVCGHRRVVVEELADRLDCSRLISGVAQLGSGRLALALSIPHIIERITLRRAGTSG